MKSLRFLLSAVLAIAISFALVQITQASSEPTQSGFNEIEYFEGNWQC
jgi:hypothetical protein